MIKKIIPKSVINYGKHLPEAILANTSSHFAGRKLRVIGVTGTDGKTTTVNMIYQILKDAGKKVSMVSTINAFIGNKSFDTGFHVTSPKSADIQKYLMASLKEGDEYMVLEVTSHALAQFRVWGIKFEVGIVTNITHEHLNYHGNFENYLKAKAKLIKNVKYAILNRDDPSFEKLAKSTLGKVLSFGMKKNADCNPYNLNLKLKLLGDYNIYNAEAAFLTGQILGLNEKQITKSLEEFDTLPGRMEEIPNKLGIKIVVDFAHTPNALENALKSLKPKNGRLISVFGCASERDIEKRPLMGGISAKYADLTILTDEDPRFENREKIIDEISAGFIGAGGEKDNLCMEPDRQKAISLAINLAKKGDVVGIFGKGHEKSMNYKGIEKDWSDQRAVLNALRDGRKN